MDHHEGLPPFALLPADSVSTRWERWIQRLGNYLIVKDVQNDARQRAMLLHYAGEDVFDLAESVGVIPEDKFKDVKDKLTKYFAPKRNIEFEVFTFRQAQQKNEESLDQFHAKLQQLAKNCEFANKDREIKSQVIQKCLLQKVRDKGLCESGFTLEQLLTYGRTVESTKQQSKAMSNHEVHAMRVEVNHTPQNKYGHKTGNSQRPFQRKKSYSSATPHYSSAPTPKYSSQATSSQPSGNTKSKCGGCGGGPHGRRSCPA